jgi:SAM-dependent methyltransferase
MSGRAPLATRLVERCPGCGATEFAALPLRYEHRGSFPMVECAACGLRFLSLQPSAEGLRELYGAEYFESDFRCGRSDSGYFAEDAFREENRGLLDAFEALRPPGRLLEVGCAGGWLLRHAIERGWQARGVELSADAVAHARTLGLEVFHGDLIEAALPAASFDLVYMGDVLEHVPEPLATLTEVARVLAPGGYLYLRGPITTHSLARRLALTVSGWTRRDLVLREPPYHLLEFTPRSLSGLARRAGLEVVSLRQSKIPPGRAHGQKTPLQRAAMAGIDLVNVPLTRTFNVLGDRVVLVARKPG